MIQYRFDDGIRVVVDDGFVIAVDHHDLQANIPVKKTQLIQTTHKQINEYLAKKRRAFTIPYKLIGTQFQVKVWQAVVEIPYGEMRSYRAIADRIHHPRASRAVGTACNRCVLAYLVPCHRVVSSRGIGGYGTDLSEKIVLLNLESEN